MTTRLDRFTQRAQANPRERFTSLMGCLAEPAGLRESFEQLDGRKAAGVDGMRKGEYAQGLDARLTALSDSLRRMGYRPQPVRRVYIPKGDGRFRPLGIPSFEDKIVQDRLSRILQGLWEPLFRDCSHGFRPGRSAHDALRHLATVITNEGTQWVVEADIKGFFDHVSHDDLMRFLAQRIADPNLLRLIRRFLKAGVMEEGVVRASDEGTPQGGLVSPVLANIYLHYVLDLWFEKRYAKTCHGTARLVRYADDFVACFTHEDDARRFHQELTERLAVFELEVEPSKTAILRFGSRAAKECRQDGRQRPETFQFLGLTHYVGRSRRGRFVVGRKTDGKRFRKKLQMLSDTLRSLRAQGARAMLAYVIRHLSGHIRYYGVSGNIRSLNSYVYRSARLLFKWLNRRSQRRSLDWETFSRVITPLLPRPRIHHNLYPVPLWMPQTGSRMV